MGSRREVFADPYLIASLDGASHRLHAPRPGAIVFEFDRPWEGRYCGYVTIIEDGGAYRMYYRGLPRAGADGSPGEVTCVAESRDGVAWTRPDLGLFEVGGTRKNNVVLAGAAPFSHNFSPFIDARPGCPPEERYKAIAGTSASGLAGFVSADGIRWRKVRDAPLITKGAFDSQNVAFWSQAEECYACYFRTFEDGVRWISRTTSPDFLSWSEPVSMRFGDAPREHLYTNQTVPYPRAPHLYVAIAARFFPGRRAVTADEARSIGIEPRYAGDCSDAVLLTSRGGDRYDRTFLEAFIRPGPGPENWTSRTNYPARGIVPAGPGELALYVQRRYGQPEHGLQRLLLRADGFASIHAPYAGGAMTTVPLRFAGKALEINISTSAAGEARVEIQDEARAPIEGRTLSDCDPIIGDAIDRIVTWKGASDVSAVAGRTVRLRFVLKDADLFAIRFRP
ncbi:MAG: hypothetical protein JXP34_05035 [Planctomycetes bacterium]|nr:hypothetical protein [Planctomycetota bacterium]